MGHLERYQSTQSKRAKEKKDRAKIKSGYYDKTDSKDKFIVGKTAGYDAIVIETSRYNADVLYNGEVIQVELSRTVDGIPNKLLYPGDKVILAQEIEKMVISNIVERSTCLSRIRKDSTRRNDKGNLQIIAANIDMAAIVVSAKAPPLHPKFIDRYLMIIQKNSIEPIVVLNKADLKTIEDERILDIYRKLEINVIETSTINGLGISELKAALKGKQAIFVGNSGVGKSSLTNALMAFDEILVSHVSDKSGKGRHTTTSSKYYIWDDGASIIDTPGIRSLDVSGFEPKEVQDYFPEILKHSVDCKYGTCLHYKDSMEICGVKQAVQQGFIDERRYKSYIRIITDLCGEKVDEINLEKNRINNPAARSILDSQLSVEML